MPLPTQPPTVRERILAALAVQLAAGLGIGVSRNRDAAVSEFPRVVMRDGDQAPPVENTGLTHFTMAVEIEGHVQASPTAQIGTTANQLYGAILAAAFADRTVGGLAIDIREGDLQFEREEGAAVPTGAIRLQLLVDYGTREGDPFTVGP